MLCLGSSNRLSSHTDLYTNCCPMGNFLSAGDQYHRPIFQVQIRDRSVINRYRFSSPWCFRMMWFWRQETCSDAVRRKCAVLDGFESILLLLLIMSSVETCNKRANTVREERNRAPEPETPCSFFGRDEVRICQECVLFGHVFTLASIVQ